MPSSRRTTAARPPVDPVDPVDAMAEGADDDTTGTEAPAAEPADSAAGAGPRVLKKYPNRRLYDTRSSSYITLHDVKAMVLSGETFEVRDAKTAEDITRSILLQIILEEESGGVPMFSSAMLANIIRFYGHAMQGLMGSYLEKNLQAFVEMQSRFAEQSRGLYDPKRYSPEAWAQLISGQAPFMQGLMGNYVEQSKAIFSQMQDSLQAGLQSGALFPGMPGFGTPPKR